MSYIITAKVYKNTEDNIGGDVKKVNATILSEDNSTVVFDIPGNFEKRKELTKTLCNSLINSGFVSFKINHSY